MYLDTAMVKKILLSSIAGMKVMGDLLYFKMGNQVGLLVVLNQFIASFIIIVQFYQLYLRS